MTAPDSQETAETAVKDKHEIESIILVETGVK